MSIQSAEKTLWSIPGSQWKGLPGRGWDIAVSPDNSAAFHMGDNSGIHHWNGRGWDFTGEYGYAVAGGLNGDLWFITTESWAAKRSADGKVYKWSDTRAADISCGSDGTAWICFYHPNLNHRGIWRLKPGASNWEKIPGHGSRISGGNGRNAWHIGEGNRIYRMDDAGNWQQIDGIAYDIGVGPNDEAWHIGTEDQIYFRTEAAWKLCDGDAKQIATGPNGLPWISNAKGEIYHRI